MWRPHLSDSRRRSEAAGREAPGPLRRIAVAIRRFSGMPDYPAHLEHLRRCHPERPLPSEREFFEEYLRARYADGPTRCC